MSLTCLLAEADDGLKSMKRPRGLGGAVGFVCCVVSTGGVASTGALTVVVGVTIAGGVVLVVSGAVVVIAGVKVELSVVFFNI